MVSRVLLCALSYGLITVLLQGSRCEFTVGLDSNEQPTVGFCLGAYKDGITAVVPPAGCRNVSVTAAACADLLQRFVRKRSRLPAWDKRCNSGALHIALCLPACCQCVVKGLFWKPAYLELLRSHGRQLIRVLIGCWPLGELPRQIRERASAKMLSFHPQATEKTRV